MGVGVLGISPKHFEEKSAFHGDGTAVTGTNMPKEGVLTAFKRNTLAMARSSSAPGKGRSTTEKHDSATVQEKAVQGKEVPLSHKSECEAQKPGYVAFRPADENMPMSTSPAIVDGNGFQGDDGLLNQGKGLDLLSERSYDDELRSEEPRGRRHSLDDRRPSVNALRDHEAEQPRRGQPLPLAPLLSEALLLEKGRRQLKAKGQDPDSVTLRVASRSTTPIPHVSRPAPGLPTPRLESGPVLPGGHYLVVSPPGKQVVHHGVSSAAGHVHTHGALAPGGRKTFKTPVAQAATIPVRAATKSSRPDTPKQEETPKLEEMAKQEGALEASKQEPGAASVIGESSDSNLQE